MSNFIVRVNDTGYNVTVSPTTNVVRVVQPQYIVRLNASGAVSDVDIDLGLGDVNADILPDTDLAYTIGNEDLRFLDIHGDLDGAVTFRAKNRTGVTLAKGTVVYINGVSGEVPTIAPASASNAATMPAFGVLREEVADNNDTHVVTLGSVTGINLPSATYTLGDNVYVSTTSGQFTNTPPAGEANLIQNIGYVARVNSGGGPSGVLKVGGAGRTNAVPNLNDGDIFLGNASNQAAPTAISTIALSSFNDDLDYAASSHTHTLSQISDAGTAAASDTGDFAAASHEHAASEITSGTLSVLRIPNLAASKITSGTFADSRIASSNVTQHAGDIDVGDLGNVTQTGIVGNGSGLYYNSTTGQWTSGGLTATQIPTLTLSKISDAGTAAASDTTDFAAASHTHTLSQISDAGTAAASNTGDFAAASHTHAINDLSDVDTTGAYANAFLVYDDVASEWVVFGALAQFDAARIPDLAASKITSGTLDNNRLANIPVGKLTGTLQDAQVGESNVTQHATAVANAVNLFDLGNVTGTIYGTGSGIYYDGANWTAGALTATQIPTLTLSKISDAGTAAASDTGDFAAASHTHTISEITDLSDPVTSPAMTGVSAGSITGVIKCSQAQYDAITPDASILYVIV